MIKTNFTIELTDKKEVHDFQGWLATYVNILDYRILPDTKELYQNDQTFQKLSKMYYNAKNERDKYINEHNKE